MELLWIIYCAVVAAAVATLLGVLAWGELRRRRQGRDRMLRDKYLRIAMLALTGEGDDPPRFPLLGRPGTRLLLAETLAGLVAATYGMDSAALRRIVEHYGLERWLLRRIRWTQGYRRARRLALLACLPLDGQTASRVERYTHSRNRYVRFYALMTQLAAEPENSLRRMAGYEHPFSACEVSEIMTMLRRGMLPVAYVPLIESPNPNLRMVGLGIVRQFGIEEAEKHLLRMVASDEVPELGREALYTLCAMQRPLLRRNIEGRLASMSSAERKALLRYMAQGDYSPAALKRLFDERERPYYESLVHSYKRNLVC